MGVKIFKSVNEQQYPENTVTKGFLSIKLYEKDAIWYFDEFLRPKIELFQAKEIENTCKEAAQWYVEKCLMPKIRLVCETDQVDLRKDAALWYVDKYLSEKAVS